jgi:F5/8 type C domain/Alpha-L-fucosidase
MLKLSRLNIGRCILALLCAMLVIATAAPLSPAKLRASSTWFGSAKYGLNTSLFPAVSGISANGSWDKVVAGFDVAAFAQDVRATGAKYVIFSVGQTSGFYSAPNQFFMSRTGTKLGEYVPRRDLLRDVARALRKYQIPTLVYIAAEGPTAAPPHIRKTFPATDDQANAENRSAMNAMIQEWSKRWGAEVAGWWIDGCYPSVNGFSNQRDGEANVGKLLAASKAGNPAAISTCNASSSLFKPLSTQEDFLAGEEAYFHRYPRQRFIQHRGRDVQWHTMSFLGDKWGEAGTKRYSSDRLASYVKHVGDLGGVVTIDVALSATGRINPGQLAQLAKIKKVVRDGAALKTYPSLTQYKPVYLLSNRPSSRELPINGASYLHYGSYAVDGLRNLRQNAQASVEADWNLLVDLMRPQRFQRSTITFPPDNYPTKYQILSSRDRTQWSVITTKTIDKGGTYDHKFPVTTARYVQVKALAPNQAGQPGDQMAISEFELFP